MTTLGAFDLRWAFRTSTTAGTFEMAIIHSSLIVSCHPTGALVFTPRTSHVLEV